MFIFHLAEFCCLNTAHQISTTAVCSTETDNHRFKKCGL